MHSVNDRGEFAKPGGIFDFESAFFIGRFFDLFNDRRYHRGRGTCSGLRDTPKRAKELRRVR